MYNAFIQPYFIYGLEVWGHSIKSASDSLVKLQSKVLRTIYDYKRSEDAWNYNNGRIKSIEALYESLIKKMCVKHHSTLLPKTFAETVMPKLSVDIFAKENF